MSRICFHCLSERVHRSRVRSWPERLLCVLHVAPFRCQSCFRRYWDFVRAEE